MSENFNEKKTADACARSFRCFWCSGCFMPEIGVSKLKWGGAPFALSNGISLAYWDLCSWKGRALTLRLNTCSILICCCLTFRILDELYCSMLRGMRLWCSYSIRHFLKIKQNIFLFCLGLACEHSPTLARHLFSTMQQWTWPYDVNMQQGSWCWGTGWKEPQRSEGHCHTLTHGWPAKSALDGKAIAVKGIALPVHLTGDEWLTYRTYPQMVHAVLRLCNNIRGLQATPRLENLITQLLVCDSTPNTWDQPYWLSVTAAGKSWSV